MRDRRGLIGVLLLLVAASAAAQSPAARWQTLETAHFRIHYPAPFETWARRVASRIEAIHTRVTEYVGYSPQQHIEVVVEDPAAAANGVAFPFLDRPVIVLWTTPPESEFFLGESSDWPDLVLTYEMTHIVHLLRPRSQSRGLLGHFSPRPIGPVLRKSPRWAIEGYASLVEGALAGPSRPQGSFRAMVIRCLAIERKLPEYRRLNSFSSWIGGEVPYLVGSTYLEWLEALRGRGSLQRLWMHLASHRGGFSRAFRAEFDESPTDLYDRFREQTTAKAIAEEKRLRDAGLTRGELWQRLEGSTASPQVSPDGRFLLARREGRRGRGQIVVWEIAHGERERKATGRGGSREPGDAGATAAETAPPPLSPRWALADINGYATTNPRWMPDGRNVLFSRRSPDPDGVLHSDLHLWNLDTGSVRRVTRQADVAMADPSPDGRSLVGVANRYGLSRLVRIDTGSGLVETLSRNLEHEDPWRVWIHPRISPDGRRLAVLAYAAARWRVMVMGLDGEGARELALEGFPIGPPAWSPDGTRLYLSTDASGVWNLASMRVAGGGVRFLTRVPGGALAPAPTPDGEKIFYLEVTAHGLDLRLLRLEARKSADPAAAEEVAVPSVLPRPAIEVTRPSEVAIPAPHPYRAMQSQVIRTYLGESLGPSGATWQFGLEGSDVIGRWQWLALGSVGTVSGPRGAAVSVAYRGWPETLRGQLFDALERPGAQSVLRQPLFDQDRRGAFAEALWQTAVDGGELRLSAGGGSSRVEALAEDRSFGRSLAATRFEGSLERSRGHRGLILDWELSAAAGRTDGSSWSQALAGARLTALAWKIKLRLSGRLGETGGSPTRFDLFSIGGAPSSLFPEGLDRNRLALPALPADVQTGRRAEHWRMELAPYSMPMSLFYERARAWSSGEGKPDSVKAYGAELRFDQSLLPFNALGTFDFYAGIARIASRLPEFATTRLYAGIVYHP